MTDTINTVPSANAASFNTNLTTFLKEEDAERFILQFVGAVVSGGLHSTAAGLTESPGPVVGFPGGFYVSESGSITYDDAKANIWVVLTKDTTTTPPSNWSRVSGTHYMLNAVSATQPTWPDDSSPLMRVTTAGGGITFVDDLRPLGALPFSGNVRAQRTAHTILDAEHGTFFTNEGATGAVALTLPNCRKGLTFEVYVAVAQTFGFTAGSGDTIRQTTTVSASGGTATNNAIGGYLKITGINDTEWVVVGSQGSWSIS